MPDGTAPEAAVRTNPKFTALFAAKFGFDLEVD
jgi:hypothetical protein